MNNTGIVRKIDDLGRIVLPKELRKSLNILAGDDFEIILNDEKIVLQKYSRLKNYNDEINKLIKCFSSVINAKINIVINNKSVNNDKELNPSVTKIINERKMFVNERNEKINLFLNEIVEGKIVIFPIVSDSDLLGATIIVGDDKIDELIKISKIINNIIKTLLIN